MSRPVGLNPKVAMKVGIVAVGCIEVYSSAEDGRLLGYAIFWSGAWEAWAVSPYDSRAMHKIDGNFSGSEQAISCVVSFAGAGYGTNRRIAK